MCLQARKTGSSKHYSFTKTLKQKRSRRNSIPTRENILADLKVITESREGPKKTVFITTIQYHGMNAKYRMGWLTMVETSMIDILNIRANVHTLAKWRRPRHHLQPCKSKVIHGKSFCTFQVFIAYILYIRSLMYRAGPVTGNYSIHTT